MVHICVDPLLLLAHLTPIASSAAARASCQALACPAVLAAGRLATLPSASAAHFLGYRGVRGLCCWAISPSTRALSALAPGSCQILSTVSTISTLPGLCQSRSSAFLPAICAKCKTGDETQTPLAPYGFSVYKRRFEIEVRSEVTRL